MRFVLFLIILVTGCSPTIHNSDSVTLFNLDEAIEFYKGNPMPFPAIITQISNTNVDGTDIQTCVHLNNGVLGEYTNNQSSLIGDNTSIYLNTNKVEALHFYENMSSFTDADGKAVNTGFSQVCFDLPQDNNGDLLAYFELTLNSRQKYMYIWTLEHK